jgi:toxin ParE1/3/4
MKRLSIHENAERELIDAATFYESQRIGFSLAFIDEVERAVEQILTYPLSCQLGEPDRTT